MGPAPRTRLDSWKSIAEYLSRHVRTVTRWAETQGLPVHQVPGGKRRAVFAYTDEIDAWLTSQDRSKLALDAADESNDASEQPRAVVALADGSKPELLPSRFSLSRRRNWIWLAACGALVLILGLAVEILALIPRASGALRVDKLVRLTDDGRWKTALRSDGVALYFSEFEGNREILASRPVRGGPIRRIDTPFPNVRLQDVSADGLDLLVTSYDSVEAERQLWIIPAQGGVPHRVGSLMCHTARWSPDNHQIAYSRGTSLFVSNANGSGEKPLGTFTITPVQLEWSPNGTRLRFLLRPTDGSAAQSASAWEIEIGSGAMTPPASRLPLDQGCCEDWAWTRDGTAFAYVRTNGDGQPTLVVQPQPRALAPWIRNRGELPLRIGAIGGLAPAKAGDRLYLLIANSPHRGELLKFDVKQMAFQTFLPGLSGNYISFSQDGQWITYVSTLDGSSLDGALWRSREDGTEALRLTAPPMSVELSAWSPDGRQVAFTAKEPGKPWRIFLVSKDGGMPREAAIGDDGQGGPTWSPDGRSLVYANVECQERDACWVRRLDLASRTSEILPGSHGFRTARWSRDGRYIAALQPENHQLVLWDFATRKWTVLAAAVTGDNINWSRDSKSVYVNSLEGGKPVVDRIRISDGRRQRVISLVSVEKMPGDFGNWLGLATDDSPILLHLLHSNEIHALDWVNR